MIYIDANNVIVPKSDVASLDASKLKLMADVTLNNSDEEVKVDYSNLGNTVGAYSIKFYTDSGVTKDVMVFVVDKYASEDDVVLTIDNKTIDNGSVASAKTRDELDRLLLENSNVMAWNVKSSEKIVDIKVDSSEIKFDKDGKTIPGTYNVKFFVESMTRNTKVTTVSATVVIKSLDNKVEAGNDTSNTPDSVSVEKGVSNTEKLAQTGAVNFILLSILSVLGLLAIRFKIIK